MKKCKLILVQALILVVLISTSVYATLNTTITLTKSASKVSRGNKVTVKLSLKDVDASKKITSVSGYINYNKDILDEITVNSIKKDSDDTVKIGNENLKVEDLTNATIDNMPSSDAYIGFNGNPTSDNDVRLVIDFKDGVTSDVDLLSIDFNVKDNATIGEVKNAISYSMFVVSSSSDQSEEITRNLDLTIEETQNNNDNNNDNDNNNNNNNDNDNNNNNNNNDNNENNNNNGNGNNGNNNNNGNNSNNGNNNNNNNNNNNTNTNKNSNTNTNTNTNSGRATSTNTNTNTNRAGTTSNGKDNTLSSGKLPSTGAKIVVLPLIVLAIISYISYRKYKKYKDIV